ncbi:MAG: hypothetical protein HC865_04230 [Cyanobacteria bacterium RU_5_0]|nr:hypothetical protein [Cyanobacteria bacterium RU_5_0]
MTATKVSRSNLTFWFSFSLMVAVICGILALQQAFSTEYVVQDDARQHVFWMRRFLDPALFPNDRIADYFQSVAPWGYTNVYRFFATFGIDPLLLSKLLPMALGLVTAAYGFGVCYELLPVPFAAFLGTLLIEQVVWTHDDIASASPRGFMPPIFLAFLYYLMHRQLVPCLVTIALEGLFYPQYVFVFSGIILLQPLRWEQGRFKLSTEEKDYWFCSAALAVAFLVMLPYALTANDYGPTITATEARGLAEFSEDGRSKFFIQDTWAFWLYAERSGVFPAFRPVTIAIGGFLPLLLRFPDRFPLIRQITDHSRILLQIVATALGLFLVAHLLLFKLHLPSRYTAYTLRFTLRSPLPSP